jgi:hypothetical protein
MCAFQRDLDQAIQSGGLKVIDMRCCNRSFVRILLKEGFRILYTRRDVIALIGQEALHIKGVNQINNVESCCNIELQDRFPYKIAFPN